MSNPAAAILRDFSGHELAIDAAGRIDWPEVERRYPMLSTGEKAVVDIARDLYRGWDSLAQPTRRLLIMALIEALHA